MRKSLIASVAAIALAAGWTVQASAADLPMFEPAPPPPLLFTWTGFYVGGHLGYGEGNFSGRFHPGLPGQDPGEKNLFFSSVDPNGILGGIQAGYNWQAGAFVLGLEGDVSFLDWDDRVTNARGDWIEADVGLLASVRGRLGVAFDRVHIYGTGGIAFSDAKVRAYDIDTDTRGSAKVDNVGWVAGGGAEFMITESISLRAEGLYYSFRDSSNLRGIGDHPEQDPNGGDYGRFRDAWVIRGGANFHF